jgi:hypothetical protein
MDVIRLVADCSVEESAVRSQQGKAQMLTARRGSTVGIRRGEDDRSSSITVLLDVEVEQGCVIGAVVVVHTSFSPARSFRFSRRNAPSHFSCLLFS